MSLVVTEGVKISDFTVEASPSGIALFPFVEGGVNKVVSKDDLLDGLGSVTSISFTVPTGLEVTGSPITTSGTFAITFTSGYSIPTTAKQSQWDSAYSNLFETIALSDETTNLAVAQSIYSYRPKVNGNWTAFRVYTDVDNPPTGSTLIVDIKKNGVSILSTLISIDATEATSTTAATPYVISTAAFLTTDNITVHITQVGSTLPGKGLKLDMYFTRT